MNTLPYLWRVVWVKRFFPFQFGKLSQCIRENPPYDRRSRSIFCSKSQKPDRGCGWTESKEKFWYGRLNFALAFLSPSRAKGHCSTKSAYRARSGKKTAGAFVLSLFSTFVLSSRFLASAHFFRFAKLKSSPLSFFLVYMISLPTC